MIVAIDGPAGSGKSTIAQALAEKLKFLYLDTGALYRALTLKVIAEKINPQKTDLIVEAALSLDVKLAGKKVFLKGKDVTYKIRTLKVDRAISDIAAIAKVRKVLVELQRKIASSSNCVVEGRDTTTVVFPEAEVKIFLDAKLEERTARRYGDFRRRKVKVDRSTLAKDLKRRDDADRNRKVGALKKATSAVYLDTTDLTITEVVNKVYSLVKKKRRVKES